MTFVPRLVVGGKELDLTEPVLMGIINATPDSFSDGGLYGDTVACIELAGELVGAGATVIDIGGQSAITGVPEVSIEEEISRIAPVIEGIHRRWPDLVLSADAYRPPVVEAALDAGASIVNDISGLLYPETANLCAAANAGLVVMHTRAPPKVKVLDPRRYDPGDGGAGNVTDDVVDFLTERLAEVVGRGVATESTIVDPGPDFAKTPHQTVQVLRDIERIRALGRPVLLALSRKDFIGAITGRPPRQRLAGTLAAIGYLVAPGSILRVHDVDAVADYLEATALLRGS